MKTALPHLCPSSFPQRTFQAGLSRREDPSALGYAEWCGVYPQKPARRVTLDEAFEIGQEPSRRILQRMKPG